MKEKSFGIIIAERDYKSFVNQNNILIEDLSKNFKKIYVINVLNLKLRQKKTTIKGQKYFPINFIDIQMNNSEQFINFFKNKNFTALQILSKNPDYFKIYYLIKKVKIKNIMIMNLGNFGNKQTIEWSNLRTFKISKHLYDKGFYYIFRILTILKVFPKIDLLFESNSKNIKALNNGFSRKLENYLPFLEIAYFRKIVKVNSVYFQYLKKKKRKKKNNHIIFVDTPLNHPDRVKRERAATSEEIKTFYKKLNKILKYLSSKFNKKIIICPHPTNTEEVKYLKDFKISNKNTFEEILNCEIAVFTLSSAILSAVVYNKKIINLESKFLGNYLSNFKDKYVNSLKLFSINLDNEIHLTKSDLIKKMNNSISNYKKFIKSRLITDGNQDPNQKIIKIIKKEFF